MAYLGARAASDSDTLAFYPFTDQAVGETAETGDIIANSIGDGAYSGTVKRLGPEGGSYGTLTFESFPCPYIYSDGSCTTLLTTEVQAIHIMTNEAQKAYGAAVIFTAVAEALREYGGDYTIEVFWKDNVTVGYYTCIADTIHSYHSWLFGYPRTQGRVGLRLIVGGTWGEEIDYPQSINDGYWHHLAMIYDSTAQSTVHIGDYSLTASNSEAGKAQASDCALILGAEYGALTSTKTGGTRDMLFACLRVTKRKLAVSEFMRAYAGPVAKFRKAPEFHWGMDGTNGEKIVKIGTRTEDPILDTQGSSMYADRNWDKLQLCNGNSTQTNPVYRVEADRAKRTLRSGEKIITNKDYCSGELINSKGYTYGMASGYGFAWPTNDCSPEKEAFTLECLVRLNLPNWQEKVIKVNEEIGQQRYRTTFMGRQIANETGIWTDVYNFGAFSLRANPSKNGLTNFDVVYTYYDEYRLPHSVKQAVCVPGKKSTYYMTNEDFGNSYHHFAYTYDPDALKLCLYIDYVLYTTVDLPGELTLDHSPNWKFGVDFNCGAFDGWYDEIRLSRGILDPSQFLKMTRPNRPFMIIYR